MTDNRTNEPTPEQIVRATLLRCQFDTLGDKVADVVKDLRAHGLLSEGAPSEAQARAIRKLDNVQAILAGAQASVTDAVRELSLTSAALTAAQGAAPQAEQATYLNVAHSSVLAGSINARRAAREVSAMQLIDAIYDPDEDDANDSVRYGYVLEQFERLRVIYADLDDPDAGPAQVLPSSGVDEDKLAEVLMRHEFNALGQCTCGYATPDYGSGNRLRIEEKRHFARALCEAYTEGKLT